MFALTAWYAAVPASASGSVDGVFPERVITLSRTSQKDNSYTVDETVPGSGSWWVELESIDGSWVLVQVYDSMDGKGKPVVSTDLKIPTDASKPVWIPAGDTYLMRLTYFGKTGSAVLKENFVEQLIPPLMKHDPIQIWGDDDFTAENGVIAGTGSEGDPYVISGWMINGGHWYWGIMIGRTTSCFVVSDCLIYHAASGSGGVGVYSSQNGVVQDVVAYNCPIGIDVTHSEDIIVRDCITYSNDVYGISVYESNRVVVESSSVHDERIGIFVAAWGTQAGDDVVRSNIITNCEQGIYADRIATSTIDGNTITGGDCAIVLGMSSGCVVSNNFVQSCVGSWGAIYLRYDANCVVDGNVVEQTGSIGICVLDSDAITVSGNTVSQGGTGVYIVANVYGSGGTDIVVKENVLNNNFWGLQLFDITSATVYGNDFVNNLYQAYQGNSFVTWDHLGAGNYWSDYGGTDLNGDGIGDTPYCVLGGGIDNYPLMTP